MNFIRKFFDSYSIMDAVINIFKYAIGYPLLLVSYLIPRQKDKWVFGNKNGFVDNGKYLYIFLLENTHEKVYWISSNRELITKMRCKGLPAYYKFSIKGVYHLLTAYYYVCVVITRHICYWTSGGSYKINLWHGVGLKAMGHGGGDFKDYSLLSRLLMPYAYEKYNMFLTSSELNAKLIMGAFRLPQSVVYDGIYPRCEFIMSSKEHIRAFIDKYEGEDTKDLIATMKNYERVYIYMPTWRMKYGKKFLQHAMPDLNKLDMALKESNSLMLLKLHPSMEYKVDDMRNLTNIIYITPKMDVYPILPFTDVLITDYSSIYYDYILLRGKGCIIYDFDYKDYKTDEYAFYCDFKEHTPGTHIGNYDTLLNFISSKSDCPVENRTWLLNKFWGEYESKSVKAMFNYVKGR